MHKVAIVILNYLNYKDTIECVESIIIDKYQNKEIVIVDNGSPNESRVKLQERFHTNNGIHLLIHDKNDGFARGNNIGIRYATDVLKCEFVLVVNNDTIFKDPEMITSLMAAYKPGIGVLGPRIVGSDGKEQNPLREFETAKSKLRQNLYYRRKIANLKLNSKLNFSFKQSKWYQGLKEINFLKKKKKERQEILRRSLVSSSKTSKSLVLHGACFLLTSDYFKYYPFLFPCTFLYYEEDILTMLTRKVDLLKSFINTTYIYHKEQQSSNISFAKDKSGKTKHHIASIEKAKEIYPLDYETIKKMYFRL
ncbi:GT2 family glycosyltransferase [Anaerospora hongkongensis]|uniref:GT2 family glycosyltransferase n=1 Tax=Anaerospora hongkongensis TaxID=244830 RepID=A0A4R1Q525_9FIRM|nr:glycosyltransferase family 2 protein [Anaerospora hongkongensis]TCL36081.1 GT2 family glycosyltransferase [Anaerospora hongkongensis]